MENTKNKTAPIIKADGLPEVPKKFVLLPTNGNTKSNPSALPICPAAMPNPETYSLLLLIATF